MKISEKVKELVNLYGTRDPYMLCKFLDIKIFCFDLENIKGIYKKVVGNKYIILNKSLSSFGKERVLAHELGHVILHDDDVIYMKDTFMFPKHDKFEVEANTFAADLLISDDYVGKYEPENEFDILLDNELLYYKKY